MSNDMEMVNPIDPDDDPRGLDVESIRAIQEATGINQSDLYGYPGNISPPPTSAALAKASFNSLGGN